MSLWKKGVERTKDVKKSEELVTERDKLAAKWPAIEAAWNKEDETTVRKAAIELNTVLLMENPQRIIQARKALREAIWKRDTDRDKFQAEISQLNSEIEMLNSPVIFEKAGEWTSDLHELRNKRLIEMVEFWYSPELGKRIKYRSNFSAISEAREKLFTAISKLRLMRQDSLESIHRNIQTVESEVKRIDFTALVEADKNVSAWRYDELRNEPGVKTYTTARLEQPKPGITKIVKNYDLPQKEAK